MDSNDEKELIERLVTVEMRARSNTHRLDDIDREINNYQRMETILEMQAKTTDKLVDSQDRIVETMNRMDNRQAKFDERLDSFDKTIVKVNENLNHLNATQQSITHEMTNMKQDIYSNKNQVEEVEKLAQKNKERGKFDILGFFTNDGTKIILTAIVVAILSFIGLK